MLTFVDVVGSGSTRYVGSGSAWDILGKGMTCQVNWGHVAVVVEDDGEGHLLCHLGQPGGGIVQVVVVAVSFYLSASLVSLLILLKMSVLKPFRTSLMSRISYLSSPRKKGSFKGRIGDYWHIACCKKLEDGVFLGVFL